LAEAEQLYERALALDPVYTDSLHGLINIYRLNREYGKGRQRLANLIAKSPRSSELYLVQGILLIDAKALDEAEESLQKAISLDPTNLTAYSILGQAQVARGRLEAAATTYRLAIQKSPQEASNYILLGDVEQNRGNWQEAQTLYQKALQVHPDHPLASNNLAYVMLEHGGNVDVALSLAQNARRQLPDLPSSADTLAWAYYHKGVYRSAVALLEEALEKAPRNPTYHYHIGLAYQKSGNAARARTHLNRALQLQPDFSKAAEARNALASLQ
jgi:tetratricopeptide (TPR) repeat protein